ncbi:MAG: hypothetical protein JXA10_19470 [Anaerolineae bacterium]|nr:hypothetical protein [Anaerolineae bacterium]
MTEQTLPDSSSRSWALWTFALIITLTGGYNLLLAWDQARHAGDYRDLGVSYPPLMRAGFALFWGIIFLRFGLGLARRQQWARRWIVVVVSNYGAFSVLWLIVYAASDFGRDQIPFRAVLAVGVTLLTALIMRWGRMRQAFELLPPDTRPASNTRAAGE